MTEKTCTVCKETFPRRIEHFRRRFRVRNMPLGWERVWYEWNSWCRRCEVKKTVERRRRNGTGKTPQTLAAQRRWYAEHREEVCLARREHYQDNLEAMRAYHRAYYHRKRKGAKAS